MKAVMYGGGNIGRGFIGALFSLSGYEVKFIDVVEPVVNAINQDRKYPVRFVSTQGYEDLWIENVSAVNGRNPEEAMQAIYEADIMATAVGVNALKFIVDNVAGGIARRIRDGRPPLNIIICENLIDADKVVHGMLLERMPEDLKPLFDANVGLVEASIGRMVPVQKPEMQDGNPLRVCVEKYGYLPVDKAAFVGEIPAIKGLTPFTPFDYYIRRKLYVHNMGHATCAYLGMTIGAEYIYQAIDDPDIRILCQGAMLDSATALSKAYGVPFPAIANHVYDLLTRFENSALQDTCARVGNDTVRKLNASDRLVGSAKLCVEQGIAPTYMAVGIGAALRAHLITNEMPLTAENAGKVLQEISGLDAEDALAKEAVKFFSMLANGASVKEVRKAADKARVAWCGDII